MRLLKEKLFNKIKDYINSDMNREELRRWIQKNGGVIMDRGDDIEKVLCHLLLYGNEKVDYEEWNEEVLKDKLNRFLEEGNND